MSRVSGNHSNQYNRPTCSIGKTEEESSASGLGNGAGISLRNIPTTLPGIRVVRPPWTASPTSSQRSTAMLTRLSQSEARRLAISSQGLDGHWHPPKGKEGVVEAIGRLGYVQIDTIAVVERAHHHTLWARCPDYTPQMLHQLQTVDRRIFEYWANAASYIPMADYRFYLPQMRAAANRRHEWYLSNEGREIRKHVMARIRDEGPLRSADFKAPTGRKRGSWWDWKPAKQALEWLFDMGELMIAERRNFQRLYDLTERVLPASVNTTVPSPEDVARFIVRRVLGTWGVAPVSELRWGWHRHPGIADAVAELTSTGEVTAVRIGGLEEDWLALTRTVEAPGQAPGCDHVHILSPFDSMVIRRSHLARLFDFHCKLECYMPAPKRQWGYFCLPILCGERFIGRIDAKAHRKAKTLIVRKLIAEPSVREFYGVLAALASTLWTFAAFNGCEQVVIEKTTPAQLKKPLQRELT